MTIVSIIILDESDKKERSDKMLIKNFHWLA